MNEHIQRAIMEKMRDFHLPRYRELPDFGLRLEQVIRYVNRYVPSPVTSSMVSNYVKQKTIPGPDKKSYSQESIGYLIFVSYIKNVMSMEDIRMISEIQRKSYALDVAYDYFCDELENLLQFVSGMKPAPDCVGKDNTPEKELLRTALLSIAYKVYLDEHLRLLHAEEASIRE